MYFVYFDPLLKNEICGLGKTRSPNSSLVEKEMWEFLFSNPGSFCRYYFDGDSILEKPTYLKQCTDTFFCIAENFEFGELHIEKGLRVCREGTSIEISLSSLPFNEQELATKFPIYIENSKTGSLLFSGNFYVKDLVKSPLIIDVGILPISIFSQDIFKNENN